MNCHQVIHDLSLLAADDFVNGNRETVIERLRAMTSIGKAMALAVAIMHRLPPQYKASFGNLLIEEWEN